MPQLQSGANFTPPHAQGLDMGWQGLMFTQLGFGLAFLTPLLSVP